MKKEESFRRLAAISAIISAPLAIGSLVLGLVPVDFNFEAFSDMSLFIQIGACGANLLRWGMILDVFGYYLLLMPIAFVLWFSLKSRGPDRVWFYTFCGLSYMLIGAIGASILAAVWPPMIRAYVDASVQSREILETVFGSITNIVYGGLWGILELIPGGIWWLGIGLMLKNEQRTLGIATILLGIFALLNVFGNIIEVEVIAMPGLFVYLYFAPIWALWLGVSMLRHPGKNEQSSQAE